MQSGEDTDAESGKLTGSEDDTDRDQQQPNSEHNDEPRRSGRHKNKPKQDYKKIAKGKSEEKSVSTLVRLLPKPVCEKIYSLKGCSLE